MGINLLMALTSPVTWLLIAAVASLWRRGKGKKSGTRRIGAMRGAALDVGAAFMFLSVAYRPNHAFLMKAQILQVEDADEDDRGGPDTPAAAPSPAAAAHSPGRASGAAGVEARLTMIDSSRQPYHGGRGLHLRNTATFTLVYGEFCVF